MAKNYVNFQVALSDSYVGKTMEDPFRLFWRSELKEGGRMSALEAVIWKVDDVFLPGYIFSHDSGFTSYERLVSFPKIPFSNADLAKETSLSLVLDALNYPEGFQHELGGAKNFK